MKEFETQICTTIEQSKRLLELGLKPETADCFHWEYAGLRYIGNIDDEGLTKKDVPAWSLHKLIFMCPQRIHIYDDYYDFTIIRNWVVYRSRSVAYGILFSSCKEKLFDAIIDIIEYLIKANHFNKEYLKQ